MMPKDTQHEAATIERVAEAVYDQMPGVGSWKSIGQEGRDFYLGVGRAVLDAARSGDLTTARVQDLIEDVLDNGRGLDAERLAERIVDGLSAARSGEAEGERDALVGAMLAAMTALPSDPLRAYWLLNSEALHAVLDGQTVPAPPREPRQDQPTLDAFDDPAELAAFRTYCLNKWGEDWQTAEWVRLAEGWLAHSDFVAEEQPVDRAAGERDRVLRRLLRAAEWVRDNWGRSATQHASMPELRAAIEDVQAALVEHPETGEREGDGPCADCGKSNLLGGTYWFADNPLWNEVVAEKPTILCAPCFTRRCETQDIGIGWRAGRVGDIEDLPPAPEPLQDGGEREHSEAEIEAIAAVVRNAWLSDAEGIASMEDEARNIALDCLARLRVAGHPHQDVERERAALAKLADEARHALLTQPAPGPQMLNAKWVLDTTLAALAPSPDDPTQLGSEQSAPNTTAEKLGPASPDDQGGERQITTAHRVSERDGEVVVEPPIKPGCSIYLDGQLFTVQGSEITEAELRALPAALRVPGDFEIWIEQPQADDLVLEARPVRIEGGERFYTTPRQIQPGAADQSRETSE